MMEVGSLLFEGRGGEKVEPGNSSFEGRGGDVNIIRDEVDLQDEISELKYQNRKLNQDVADLTQQLAQSEDATIILLSQKENLKKKIEQSKLSLDKYKEQMRRDLDDTKALLASSDDKNVVLRSRISRLERDNADINEVNEELRKEIKGSNADCRIYQMQLKALAEEIKAQEELAREQVQDLMLRLDESEGDVKILRQDSSELRQSNFSLSRQKQEMKNALFAGSCRGLFAELNDDTVYEEAISDEDNDVLPILPITPCYQNNSLHAEITASLGYPQELSLPLVLQGLPEVDVAIQCDLGNTELSEEVSFTESFVSLTSVILQGQILPPYMDNQPIDELETERRLSINLPTILEEPEKAEYSPGSHMRRMNSGEKGPRLNLISMANAVLDDFKSDLEDDQSVPSSLPGSVNTLERPLQVSGYYSRKGGMDADNCSTISGDTNTAYELSITSPTSTTYSTPSECHSQDSSCQVSFFSHISYSDFNLDWEPDHGTLINRECDSHCRTPVNYERIDDTSLLEETDYFDKTQTYGITMPIDKRQGISSIGVIPESQQERMKKYAYDAVARSCDVDAVILSRTEWRTLKKDLNAKEHAHFKKSFGQEDEGVTDDGVCSIKTSVNIDLDDEAEEHCEYYSHLVEQLFYSLDDLKQSGPKLEETDLSLISQRFEQLALVFKTDHMNLSSRSEATSKCYESAVGRMKEISSSLKSCLQKIRDHKLPGEIHEDLCAMENTSKELEMYSNVLSRTARRAGRMDLETRLYKMIEVMVLYVHILKTLHRNIEEDFVQARKLLLDNDITLPSKTSIGKLHHNNINGRGHKVSWGNDEMDGSHSELMERFEDGKPKYALQHLLGPKLSNAGLICNAQELVIATEKHSTGNFMFRYLSDWYEIVRQELYWPWFWDQTWKGLKQGFSGVIMIVGLLIIAGSVIPNVGAQSDEYSSILTRLFSIIAKYGHMAHNQVPDL